MDWGRVRGAVTPDKGLHEQWWGLQLLAGCDVTVQVVTSLGKDDVGCNQICSQEALLLM